MSSPAGQEAAACTGTWLPCAAWGGSAGRRPKQDLVVPVPVPNPLHESCHPSPRCVPARLQGHEGPVPSVPAALYGPGICVAPHVAPFCTNLPGFTSPLGIAVVFPLPPQLRAGAAEAGGAAGCCPQLACGVCWALGALCPLPWAVRAAQTSVLHRLAQGSFQPRLCAEPGSAAAESALLPGPALGQRLCPALPVMPPSSLHWSQT